MNKYMRENIYTTIRDQITYGQINPGERLTESGLATQFKSSRSPVREALRQLESEGLITLERNKGITVSKLSIKQVDEIYSIRWLLESYATRLTAEKATPEEVRVLRGLHEGLKKAAKGLDLEDWLRQNTMFHDFLEERCGNTNLIPILQTLKRRTYRYKYVIIRIPGHFDEYIEHHEGILRGCSKRDGVMAERFMKLHLATVKQVTTGYLEKFEEIPAKRAAM